MRGGSMFNYLIGVFTVVVLIACAILAISIGISAVEEIGRSF